MSAEALVILNKPRLGDPCNRCGHCCRKLPCQVSAFLLGAVRGACGALVEHPDGTTSCGMMVDPLKYATNEGRLLEFTDLVYRVTMPLDATTVEERIKNAIRHWMGTGSGCDSADLQGIDADIPSDADIRDVWLARKRRNRPENL